ncbi:hypothetical protein KZZ52_37225 [Dactylosporangium sp. AC04546]|uniref:hypothetical protein n=1 Tax=Dactylosporangium sp. AC04546 TaxID=2862460 RepID=UPI001EDE8BF0|nr:hypothetical protein [Dactylosporangium sp. AC04546]WVK79609.1 hypothetical protein KZZ52_37225 [Dactylosporangium sp. AC04546]
MGLLAGAGVVAGYQHQHPHAPMPLVWAALAVALGGCSGGILTYGLRRWAELTAEHPARVREVAGPVVAIAVGGVLAVNVTRFLPGPTGYWHSGLLVCLAILAGVPAGTVMFAIRRVASAEPCPGPPGRQVTVLLGLRRLLQRLLAAEGAVVTLVTFQFGAYSELQPNPRPAQYVLIFGGVGSVLVAAAYVPAWTALRHRAHLLCRELFPLDDLDDGATILSNAADGQRLEQVLGADRGILADLQNGLAVAAPLLAGAVAAFLPH